MGRKRKYFTKEEIRLAQNEYVMQYYWRNVELIRKKNLERYYRKKMEKLNEEMSKSNK